MYTGRTLFSQVMDFVPWTSFNRIVAKYRGDRDTRTLRCTEHFRVMVFAQVTYRESLRDIEACLGAQPANLANTVYALDSTTIDLCLSLFPWADFRSTKAAVKMHTLLDLRGPIPSFIHVSDGKMAPSRSP